MGAAYRLTVASLCIAATLVIASASNVQLQSAESKSKGSPSVNPATQPQAVQIASTAMTANSKRADTNVRATTQSAPAGSKHQQSKAAAPSGVQQQQQQQQPAQILPQQDIIPDLPGIPISFYGDTMGKLTKDIRGVYLDLLPRTVLVTMRENGDPNQAPSAFTYS